jgi:hypothetical protein
MLAGSTANTGTRKPGVPGGSALGRAVGWGLADAYRLGVAGITAALAAFLLLQGIHWPAHEDETLVFFVSRQPLGDLFSTVFEQRGGAPLHFLLAKAMVTVWPGLLGLRLISVVFAVASVPVMAALVSRLTDRRTALLATAIAAASWMMVYHGIYARMYSLFLFTSALSFLLLLRAVGRRDPWRWAAWALATLAAIATQPYGAFVLAVGAAFVLARRRAHVFPLRPALISIAAVTLLALPLWLVYRVLAARFRVGLTGESGSKLGSPLDVFAYLFRVAGDFTAGWALTAALVIVVAVVGLLTLVRTRPAAAFLSVAVFLIPTVAFLLTRSGSSVSLESRHLIFALPFFAMLVGAGLLRLASLARTRAPAALALGLGVLLAAEIGWGWDRTPWMYAGEPGARKAAREEAASWLGATSRADDVLFGYEPVYLDAWEKGAPFGAVFVPRADPKLALERLDKAPKPLGRGVWVIDASDQLNVARQRMTISGRAPGPQFEARAFGPFLVVRTKAPVKTEETFLRDTAVVEFNARALEIGDAGLNLQTAVNALARLRARP